VDGKDIDDLSSSARHVVDLARAARTPGDTDKRRVRQALALGIGAAMAGASSGTAAASAVKAGALVGLRGVIAALLVVSTGVGTFVWVHGHQAPPAPVPVVVPAPTPVAPVVQPLPAAAPDPLLAELTLLRQAQQALRDGSPRRALELAERHAALYPRSQLALERGALRVFAFCALGRKADARALAAELLAAAPRSPLRTSLEESCAAR
jgi:hypothetical protein